MNASGAVPIPLPCRSLPKSIAFYRNVLGFVPIRPTGPLSFEVACLASYGIVLNLLQAEEPESLPPIKTGINPKDSNLMSIEMDGVYLNSLVESKLLEGIAYLPIRRVENGGVYTDQILLQDPDGFQIELTSNRMYDLPAQPSASMSSESETFDNDDNDPEAAESKRVSKMVVPVCGFVGSGSLGMLFTFPRLDDIKGQMRSQWRLVAYSSSLAFVCLSLSTCLVQLMYSIVARAGRPGVVQVQKAVMVLSLTFMLVSFALRVCAMLPVAASKFAWIFVLLGTGGSLPCLIFALKRAGDRAESRINADAQV